MSQFIDRNGTDLNKKRLKVVQVVRDPSTDEISELYVEEFRNDSAGLIIEGTPLNADNLNSIIRSMMNSGENTQNNKTNAQKLREVVDNLSINMYISNNFTLPSNGEYGTGITWEVFCTEINDIIVGNNVRMSSSEDKRLGAYFVKLMDLKKDQRMGKLADGEYDGLRKKESSGDISQADESRLAEIREAMKQNRRFPEKVIKYLWDDAFKFNREIIFETTEFRSLESVIRAFMYSEGIERFKMFKQNIVDALQNPDSE